MSIIRKTMLAFASMSLLFVGTAQAADDKNLELPRLIKGDVRLKLTGVNIPLGGDRGAAGSAVATYEICALEKRKEHCNTFTQKAIGFAQDEAKAQNGPTLELMELKAFCKKCDRLTLRLKGIELKGVVYKDDENVTAKHPSVTPVNQKFFFSEGCKLILTGNDPRYDLFAHGSFNLKTIVGGVDCFVGNK